MRRSRTLFAVLISGLLGVSAVSAQESAQVKEVVKGNNTFALDLYGQLAREDGNLFFSPYSISNALAMTYEGARGKTAEQMAQTLHFSLGQEKLGPAFADLIGTLIEAMSNLPDDRARLRAGITTVLDFSSKDPRRGKLLFTEARTNPGRSPGVVEIGAA